MWNNSRLHADSSESIIINDVLASFGTLEELKKAKTQLQKLFGTMGLEPRKWASNCPEALEDIPLHQRAKSITLEMLEEPSESSAPECIRTLGILWHLEEDCFQFVYNPDMPTIVSLRSITSTIARLFDPLYLLMPVTTQGKELIQAIWRDGGGWDEPVDDIIKKKLYSYIKNHRYTKYITIPRHLGQDPHKMVDLVIFTDASSKALAAVAYSITDVGQPTLVSTKHKLTGIRGSQTIPRLELAAALLGTTLAFEICKMWELDMNTVTYFTDSLTVLWWLRTTQAFDSFVGHRITKILEHSHFTQWHHVRTDENPTDLPTRGMRPQELRNCALWWEGPSFLAGLQWCWPPQPQLSITAEAAAEKRNLETFVRAS